IERQLLSLADSLREAPDTGNVRSVRRAVLAMAGAARALDVADPDQRAVRRLYEYLDASSLNAVRDRTGWLAGERADIEYGLSAVLAASRRGGSVYRLSCIRDDLEHLCRRIDGLDAVEREPLRDLFAYVDERNRQALEVAVRATWNVPWALSRTATPTSLGSAR
ncbi:hypothetical protein ACW9HQ_38455, partial [Nocardia gipuzkoensis]